LTRYILVIIQQSTCQWSQFHPQVLFLL